MKKFAKILLPILIVAIMGVGVFLGVTLVGRRQVFEQKAAPETTVYFTPDNNAPKVGEQFNVSIDMNTVSNEIVGAEIYLTFTNDVIEVLDLSMGTFPTGAQVQTSTFDNNAGTVTHIVYIPTGGQAQQGTGSLGTISFRAIAQGVANITVGANSKVAAVSVGDVGLNVLASTVPLNLTILQEAVATATLTPTGIAATATPTNTPSNTPTNTPTATTTSGSGGVATSTPTNTSTPTPTTESGTGGTEATNTNTPTTVSSAESTASQTLPDAGVAFPTIVFGLGAGLLIFFALLLAL